MGRKATIRRRGRYARRVEDDRLVPLAPEDAAAALRFCETRPHECTYIAGWIAEGGLTRAPKTPRAWLLAEKSARGGVEGLLYISVTGIMIPAQLSDGAVDHVGEMVYRNPNLARVVVGERRLVGCLWRTLSRRGTRARLARDQIGYTIERQRARLHEPLPLIPATNSHLEQVVQASAAMAREEARDDPFARNPRLFRERIAERLRRGRDFIHAPDDRLRFKSNVAALSALGGQVEGIYTVPAYRHMGLGLRGTSAVTQWVLERSPRAFLLVNEDNHDARRLYERLGYHPVIESRTVFAV